MTASKPVPAFRDPYDDLTDDEFEEEVVGRQKSV